MEDYREKWLKRAEEVRIDNEFRNASDETIEELKKIMNEDECKELDQYLLSLKR